jgi:YHS domain-containing protein
MKLLLCLALMFGFSACAHKKSCDKPACSKKTEVKEDVAFGGHCPMGLCLKKVVKGEKQHRVEYKGKIYYFSTAEAKDKFLANIDNNIKKANAEWDNQGMGRIR